MAFGGLRPTQGGTMHPVISYILGLTSNPRPKICFIPTATGDSAAAIVNFYDRFNDVYAEKTHLSLFNRTVKDIHSYLLNQDMIMVGGGNTANMLAVWRTHGIDVILREAWESGIILCGGSAGSLCWFECGTTDSFSLYDLTPLYDGLGFIPGSHCPHYDGERQRRPLYHDLILNGFPGGYAIDDDAAIHFVDTDIGKVITGRDGASAYKLGLSEGKVLETDMNAELVTTLLS